MEEAVVLQIVVGGIVVQQNVVPQIVVARAFLLQTVVARIVVLQTVVARIVVLQTVTVVARSLSLISWFLLGRQGQKIGTLMNPIYG